jgi:flagella basal body P-ring formation protein FlgA
MQRQFVLASSAVFLTVCVALTNTLVLPVSALDDPALPSDASLQVVVVPKFDLEKGSTPTESSLEEKKIEKRLAPVNAVAGISEVVGRTLKRRKCKGAIILLDDLARPGDKLD